MGLPSRWGVRVDDATVAAGFWVIGLLSSGQTALVGSNFTYTARDAWFWLLLSAATLPFAVRRSQPTTTFLVSLTALTAMWTMGYDAGALPLMLLVGAYWVAESRDLPEVVIVAGAALAGLTWLLLSSGAPFTAREWISSVVALAGVLALGRSTFQRRALDQAVSVAQVEAARRQLSEDRLEVSGELHDIVGHTLGVIAIQAGMGRRLIASDPAKAEQALEVIAELSRQSLTEVRAVIAGMRDGSQAHQPAAGVADLGQLAARVRLSGIDVDLAVSDGLDEIPPTVSAAVFRIVQEALTNTVRHAGAASVQVVVRQFADAVEISIRDDGAAAAAGSAAGTARSGHGLDVMRDRARALGGTLSAGPLDHGGFMVRARLPTGCHQ